MNGNLLIVEISLLYMVGDWTRSVTLNIEIYEIYSLISKCVVKICLSYDVIVSSVIVTVRSFSGY